MTGDDVASTAAFGHAHTRRAEGSAGDTGSIFLSPLSSRWSSAHKLHWCDLQVPQCLVFLEVQGSNTDSAPRCFRNRGFLGPFMVLISADWFHSSWKEKERLYKRSLVHGNSSSHQSKSKAVRCSSEMKNLHKVFVLPLQDLFKGSLDYMLSEENPCSGSFTG